jgi:lysophospholipase L1-like esterase
LAELDKQLLMDKPDLVIISLGTNDAFSGSSRNNFYDKIHHLATKIKTLSPGSELILTTPSDALRKNKTTGKYESFRDLQYVVSIIIQYANDHHLPYWNLHQVMGGSYSINSWVAKKLAVTDRVHFTEAGYILIGEWLFDAVKTCL